MVVFLLLCNSFFLSSLLSKTLEAVTKYPPHQVSPRVARLAATEKTSKMADANSAVKFAERNLGGLNVA